MACAQRLSCASALLASPRFLASGRSCASQRLEQHLELVLQELRQQAEKLMMAIGWITTCSICNTRPMPWSSPPNS
jgi:hypothetical protein